MNEKMNGAERVDAARAQKCERGEDLVAYMYGEAGPEDAGIFRSHLSECAVCREEFEAFGGVREAVGAWRAEALAFTPSLAQDKAVAPPVAVSRHAAGRKRSASAALREFFALSPLWLRAGALAASLLICALASLTLARTEIRWDANGIAFQTGVGERVVRERVEVPTPSAPASTEIDAIVAERVKAELAAERARRELREKQDSETLTTTNVSKRAAPRLQEASVAPARQARRKQTVPVPSPRNQRYLADEDNLPRLSDILGEVN
ncbi:MAG TPA: hypothetical protein VNA19_17265 [Pyrinomonadaceae bacterium]|jgi:hypothetical protein|nr:hypothetical protein [Pyrinomonadaceae bacterium]